MAVGPNIELVGTMRKSPLQRRSAATVGTILEASARILERDGEAGFTTNRIAERAGYSIGTLYQYFPDKTAILSVLAARERDAVSARLRAAAASLDSDGLDAVVRTVVDILIDALARPGRAVRALVLDEARSGQPVLADAAVDALADLLPAAFQAGGRRAGPSLAPVSAYVLGRAITGVIRSAVVERSPMVDTPAFADALARLALGLLGTAGVADGTR